MNDRLPLEGSISIITGARGVIGRGISRELAAAGSDVVLQIERDQRDSIEVNDAARAQPLVEEIEALGRKAVPVNCDVRDPGHVSAMADRTIETFGRLDVLVNNAGVVSVYRIEDMLEEEWDTVMDVNLKSIFLCTRAAIPHLKASRGTIINNASIASFGGASGMGHYCASKHAVIGLTKALALELAQNDVTVNAICPGIVDTPMWSEVLAPDPEQYQAVINRMIPLGRDQKPEDMGRLAVFLATNRNITGEAIKVDGGITSSVG
jgi:meso-butanediol dehydrogenase / (S,S)-butanediol dehydrogenase / diacetyl reductase